MPLAMFLLKLLKIEKYKQQDVGVLHYWLTPERNICSLFVFWKILVNFVGVKVSVLLKHVKI